MVHVHTDFGETYDSARQIRAGKVGGLTGTNVQSDLQQLDARGVNATATIRKPASSATISIITTDIEVGIDTRSTAVTTNLPSAAAWAAANPNGLELTLVDFFGNAGTNNITPSLFAGDSFQYGGVTPVIAANFGKLALRPDPSLPGWYVRGIN